MYLLLVNITKTILFNTNLKLNILNLYLFCLLIFFQNSNIQYSFYFKFSFYSTSAAAAIAAVYALSIFKVLFRGNVGLSTELYGYSILYITFLSALPHICTYMRMYLYNIRKSFYTICLSLLLYHKPITIWIYFTFISILLCGV